MNTLKFEWGINPKDTTNNQELLEFLEKDTPKSLILSPKGHTIFAHVLVSFFALNGGNTSRRGQEIRILDEKVSDLVPVSKILTDIKIFRPSEIIIDALIYDKRNKEALIKICEEYHIKLTFSLEEK